MNDKLLTVDEIADYLRVPKSWVYDKSRKREIPIIKLGRHVRIFESKLKEWLKTQ